MATNVNELRKISTRLGALAVFRHFLDTDVIQSLRGMIHFLGIQQEKEYCIEQYGRLCSEIFLQGGNLSQIVLDFLRYDENPCIRSAAAGETMSLPIRKAMEQELYTLQMVADLTATDLIAPLVFGDGLPLWENKPINIALEYENLLRQAPTRGYGMFAQHRAFTVSGEELIPVRSVDEQSLDQLYGYENERRQVLENTKALAEGRGASNVLLYGDAGTGKSSTIKACARELASAGVRLVEFDKTQLDQIPVITDRLHGNPLKFIFYIDDLSFGTGDDAFCMLKGILEGGITGRPDNIVIYATSNRRHMIRETFEDRQGTDIHLNDSLQQNMSLAARFGLAITFSKPEKDLYLEIVTRLAKEAAIDLPEEELLVKAEAFAIRRNGRSPRTARQFIQLLAIGL